MNETKDIIGRAKSELSDADAYAFQKSVLAGNVPSDELIEMFNAMGGRRFGEDELNGFFRASQESMVMVPDSSESLDTCGTGGDKSGSFNISTAAGILLAAMGIPVAKHGNRAASSKCGSADVLDALGVKIELSPERSRQVLMETGFVFMFARVFHPAFKHAAEARKIFGKRTYFNFLGPLLNPARAKYRVHGLSDFSYAKTLGKTLLGSGVERAIFVHAKDGMDEASPFSDTEFYTCAKGGYELLDEFPTSHYAVGNPDELLGGDAGDNAHILTAIFEGSGTAAQNAAVALNAGLGISIYRGAYPYRNAVHEASEALKSGIAAQKLAQIVKTTNV